MSHSEEALGLFLSLGHEFPDVVSGNLFGKPCFKLEGRAFLCFFEGEMVFKMAEKSQIKALQLSGTKHFDPSGKGRPMKEWVQIPYRHHATWRQQAKEAYNYAITTSNVG